MLNKKIFICVILSCGLVLTAIFFYNKKENGLTHINMMLAKENRKAVSWLMNDLRRAGASTMVNLPANGKTYHAVNFKMDNEQVVTRYFLSKEKLIRTYAGNSEVIADHVLKMELQRQAATSDIVDVALSIGEAKNFFHRGFQINSNFKIKVRNQ